MKNPGQKLRRFDVFVTRSDETIISVQASSEDEALELASHVLDTEGDGDIIVWEPDYDGYKMKAILSDIREIM